MKSCGQATRGAGAGATRGYVWKRTLKPAITSHMSHDTAPLIIQTTEEQRDQAVMLAMGFPIALMHMKQKAMDQGMGNMLETITEKLASVGIDEDRLAQLVRDMAMANDLRITVDGELIFRVVPE